MTINRHILAAGVALCGSALPAFADPIVVELFTSQGCSSCPPADANLIKISDRPDVLALSFGVTYWNYLGWEDTFAREEFTQRQLVYESKLGHSGAFTPQIVVGGKADVVGNDLQELEALIAAAKPAEAAPGIDMADGRVTVGAGTAPQQPADIWLVRYDPNISEVPVARGENRRRTLPITHAVKELTRLGGWTGEAMTLTLPAAADGLESAILIQNILGGEILAAKKLYGTATAVALSGLFLRGRDHQRKSDGASGEEVGSSLLREGLVQRFALRDEIGERLDQPATVDIALLAGVEGFVGRIQRVIGDALQHIGDIGLAAMAQRAEQRGFRLGREIGLFQRRFEGHLGGHRVDGVMDRIAQTAVGLIFFE
jgi:hypothetical protein